MRWPIPWVWWEGRLSDQGRFDRWLASASLLGVDARCHGICLETSIAVTWAVTVSSFVRLVSSWRPSIFLLLYCSLARSWWLSHRSHLQKESVCSVDPRGWLWGCPLGLSYNCQHQMPIRCILFRLTAPSISGHAYSLFSGNELNQWLNAVETLKKPSEIRAGWYHIRIKIGVAEPFVIARNADCQRHHFKLPFEQPFTDSMGQCYGSFSASILVTADVFVQKLERLFALASTPNSKDASKALPESSLHRWEQRQRRLGRPPCVHRSLSVCQEMTSSQQRSRIVSSVRTLYLLYV